MRANQKVKKVKATATGACFEIEVTAKITQSGVLSSEEVDNIKKKFMHSLTMSISKLPHAHIYPYEVTVS